MGQIIFSMNEMANVPLASIRPGFVRMSIFKSQTRTFVIILQWCVHAIHGNSELMKVGLGHTGHQSWAATLWTGTKRTGLPALPLLCWRQHSHWHCIMCNCIPVHSSAQVCMVTLLKVGYILQEDNVFWHCYPLHQQENEEEVGWNLQNI